MSDPVIRTCLWYDHDAEEAAIYYCSLFPGAGVIHVTREGGGNKGRAFMVEFQLQGQTYLAINGGKHYVLTPAVSISVTVDTQAEVDRLWTALLADGGTESRCGWLADRWGLSWQIVPEALPRLLAQDTTGRVMQAMMGMVKLDVAALESAARG